MILAISFAGTARAQLLQRYLPASVPAYQVDPALAVLQNGGPDYRSAGARLGDVVVRPSFDETLGYNDNPLGLSSARSSIEAETAAALNANTDWARDSLGASVSIDDQRYLDVPIADETNSTAFVGGTLEIGRDTLSAGAGHVSGNLGPTDVFTSSLAAPVPYQSNDLRLAYARYLNRLTITPQLDLTSYRFGRSSAGIFTTDDTGLDKNQVEGGLTANYELSPGHGLVFVWNETAAFFQHRQPRQPNPNYLDTLALVGFAYDTRALFRYNLLAGYEERHFGSDSIHALSDPVVETSVIFTPTRITTLSAAIVRHLSDASYNVATNLAYTEGRFLIDHEYRRNIVLSGSFDYVSTDAGQGDFSRNQYTVAASATWLVNRHARLSGSYTYSHGGGGQSLFIASGLVPVTSSYFSNGSYSSNTLRIALHLAL